MPGKLICSHLAGRYIIKNVPKTTRCGKRSFRRQASYINEHARHMPQVCYVKTSMKHKLKAKFLIGLVIAALIIGIGFWIISKNSNKKIATISQDQAYSLIRECLIVGTYSFHNGEVGVILKDTPEQSLMGASINSSPTDNFRRVRGTTEATLLQHQNSACPFMQGATE